MRSGLTLAGILIALAIVALLAKKQLATPLPASAENAREQSQQIQQQVQQQVQQQLDEAMQQRPNPEDFE